MLHFIYGGIADSTVVLPGWAVERDNGEPLGAGGVTALAFTIRRLNDGSVIGLPDRDGFNADGVTVSLSNCVVHAISPVDNALLIPEQGERRRVDYVATTAAGETVRKSVEYWLRPVGS